MSAADHQAALSRQEQIWGGLYGPPQARELIAEVSRILDAEPDAEPADVFARVEPQDDTDWDEAGTNRPGFG